MYAKHVRSIHTSSLRFLDGAADPPHPAAFLKTYSGGPDPRVHPGLVTRAEPLPCQCTPESLAGLKGRSEVVIGLSFPYKYFNSNHWFHISEYYVRCVPVKFSAGWLLSFLLY